MDAMIKAEIKELIVRCRNYNKSFNKIHLKRKRSLQSTEERVKVTLFRVAKTAIHIEK